MNRKLLITAPMHYSQRLLKAFERYKDRVDVLHIPMVESTFDNTSEQMRELCENLDKYDFVILLSRKAIESMHFHWHNRKELGSARFLAIGKDNDYMYEAQNEAYKMMKGRKVYKVVSLQRVMCSLTVEAPQNETFTLV